MSAKRKPLHCAHVAAYHAYWSDVMTSGGIAKSLFAGIHCTFDTPPDVVHWLRTSVWYAKKAVREWKMAGGVVG